MRERLAALDGRLTIEAVRGAGTRLVVRVPLARLPCTAPARTVPDA
jgi:glucose-6-phosphate-specific signal transduction histidine kinase